MKPSMTAEDVEVIGKTTEFQGYFRVNRYRFKHQHFGGGWGGEISREIFERGHAAAVLMYDPDLDRLVMIEQFRPGAYAALSSPWFDEETSPWLIEVVAGIIEDGENPEDVVRREAVEEAGCEITDIVPICHYLVSPGGSSESMFLFCGRVDSSNAGGVYGLPSEGENIRAFAIAVEEAFKLMDAGRIVNSMTLIPMQWFRMNHDGLRAQWLEAGDE